MVCWEMFPKDGETPKAALHRLLMIEQQVALDPAVSPDAKALHDEIERLRSALKPFADLARTSTVQVAVIQGKLLTVSNGARMCGIEAEAFIAAAAALGGERE